MGGELLRDVTPFFGLQKDKTYQIRLDAQGSTMK